MRRFHILTVAVFLAACDRSTEPSACRPERGHLLDLDIVDASTGAPLAYRSTVIIAYGSERDSLYAGPPRFTPGDTTMRRLSFSLGRPTVVDLEVRRAGYRAWQRGSVRVESCTNEVTLVDVRLVPAP